MKRYLSFLLSFALIFALVPFSALNVGAEIRNLAYGKSYDAVGYYANDEWGISDYTANLTDGIASQELTFDNSWFAFCTTAGENGCNAPDGIGSVTIDLEQTCDISFIQVNTIMGYDIDESGINSAERISAYVSDTVDGDFTYLGDFVSYITEGVTWAEINTSATGRYVKLEFVLNGYFAFLNEIEVYGEVAQHTPPYDEPIGTPYLTFTLSEDDTYYIVSDCNESATKIIIPETYNELPVKEIGESAFEGCYDLTSVIIGNSIETIKRQAFYLCDNLTNVELGCSVRTIDSLAFYGCDFSSIDIPNTVTTIGSMAFGACDKLTTVAIPNSVKVIDYYAFDNCSNLTKIYIPHSVKLIGYAAFMDCENLTDIYCQAMSQPTEWDSLWLQWCDANVHWDVDMDFGITSDEIYDGPLTSTLAKDGPYYIVSNCDQSARTIVIPETYNGLPVKKIDGSAFSHCYSLTSIEIPNSVTSIGNSAFFYCESLSSIKIPDSVTSIGRETFQYCHSLTNITIPNSVTSIGDYAFLDCKSLANIEIPNSVTSIGNDAFYGCESLTSISIPNSVTSIGNNAFQYCYNLTNIEIPNSVTSIGNDAFYGCESLTSIEIPNSVTFMGDNVFQYCDSLTDIYCEAKSKPANWVLHWLDGCDATVHWGVDMGSGSGVNYEYGEDISGEVEVNGDDAFESGTTVKVELINDDNLPEEINDFTKNYGIDITATKDGIAVQPTKDVMVTIDIPEDFSLNLSVYYVPENGEPENLEILIDAKHRKVYVMLPHFSKYVLVDNESKVDEETKLMKGDINGNGTIDSMDYLYLKRAFFKQYTLSDTSVGDINKNGSIDSMDYLYLKRAFFKQYVIE